MALRELIGRGTTYEREGKVFAWQFILPRKKKRFVEVKISSLRMVDSKGLTGTTNAEFDVTGTRKVGADE